ncbi:hypothetical protein GDO81_027848 [Engystomops pustulosus]|uniref:Fibroblast growth factor n=1 Tax=Engystomops pustulosus TaxID=76066 RepID=A0AAV6ZN72_ENGPU|nr:hypothetical protein GDO81_027848 [Engystomops pustulosus]
MWMRLPQILGGALLLLELLLVLGVHTLPLYDAGPHVRHGWGESIRIRRLSTARRNGQESYYLRIHQDGRVDGERHQSSLSVLEIRAVAAGLVAIKGYISSLYLCMASDGTLYGMVSLLSLGVLVTLVWDHQFCHSTIHDGCDPACKM